MQNSSFWTIDDYHAGNCRREHVGMEKPAQFARLQNENDILKKQLDSTMKMANENDYGKAGTVSNSTAENAEMKRQIDMLEKQLRAMATRQPSNPDHQLMERLQAERIALDKDKVSLAEQKAAIDATMANLVEKDRAMQKERAELDKLRSQLTAGFANLREREAALTRSLSLEERQKAIIEGDLTSITQSLVADIARLETDVSLARERMTAADKAHHSLQREERQQWHTIYATATKELRAARQQLIQLPRPTDADPRNWKNALVATIAQAMEQGNVPARTINETVSKATCMLANRSVRMVITDKARATVPR